MPNATSSAGGQTTAEVELGKRLNQLRLEHGDLSEFFLLLRRRRETEIMRSRTTLNSVVTFSGYGRKAG